MNTYNADPDCPSTVKRANAPALFFALWPDAAVRTGLDGHAVRAAEQSHGRPTPPEKLHLTLLYLGPTAEERIAALRRLGETIRHVRFTLTIDTLGWWPHNRIAWAGLAELPPPLIELQADLERGACNLGFVPDARPYAAHITLARNARPGYRPPCISPIVWSVDRFCLMQSANSRYAKLAEWPLE